MLQNRAAWQCECFKLLLGQQWVNLIGIYSTIKMEKNRLVEESQSTMEQVNNDRETGRERGGKQISNFYICQPIWLSYLKREWEGRRGAITLGSTA